MDDLFFLGHAGDHHGDIVVGGDVAQGQGSILNGATGQRLHADKADILLHTPVDQLRTLGFHDVVGEHKAFYPGLLQSLFKQGDAVAGQADVADLSCRLCLQQSLQSTAGSDDLFKLSQGGIVYLIKVNVVCAQVLQADGDILFHTGLVPGHALGGKDKMLPNSFQSLADVAFADGVAPGGVDVVDSGVLHGQHQLSCAGGVDLLNGDAAEAQTGDLQAGFSKDPVFHMYASKGCFFLL